METEEKANVVLSGKRDCFASIHGGLRNMETEEKANIVIFIGFLVGALLEIFVEISMNNH